MKTSTEPQPALTSTNGPQQSTAVATLVESFLMNVTGSRRLYRYPERADKFFKSECRTDGDGAREIEYAANVEAARGMLVYAEKALTELQGHGLPAILYQRCCRALAVWELTDADWAETAKQFESWADAATKPPAATGMPAEIQYVFRQLPGGIWELRFENESARMADAKGLLRIWKLLQSDERGISAAELMGADIAENIENLSSDAGGLVADSQAVAAIEAKIKSIELEIDDTANPERKAELEDEQRQLAAQLQSTKAAAGRTRNMQRTPLSKAANAVRKSVFAAIKSIQGPMPNFCKYLDTVKIGETCYFINPGQTWITDPAPSENTLQK